MFPPAEGSARADISSHRSAELRCNYLKQLG